MAKKPTLDHVEAALTRWRSRLTRAMNMVNKLEKQRKRLVTVETRSGKTYELTKVVSAPKANPETYQRDLKADLDRHPISATADLDLPPFLDRTKLEPASVEIAREQAEIRKRKAKGRIEKMKAKQRGDLKKMPLAGKDALRAIFGD